MNNVNIEINDNINKKTKRKFNSEFRKKMVFKIKNLKDKNILLQIFEISKKEIGDNYTENNNGIFYNINKLSDNLIGEITNILNNNIEDNHTSELKLDYTPYSIDNIISLSEYGHKLSNKEKSILKR